MKTNFKGGFINKNLLDDPIITEQIHKKFKDSLIFDYEKFNFKEKLDIPISNINILNKIKQDYDKQIYNYNLQIQDKTCFLKKNPFTEEENKFKDAKQLFTIKKQKTYSSANKQLMKELACKINKMDPESIIKDNDIINESLTFKDKYIKQIITLNKEIDKIQKQKIKIDFYLKKIFDDPSNTLNNTFNSSNIIEKEIKVDYNSFLEKELINNRLCLYNEYKTIFFNITPIYSDIYGHLFSFLKNNISQYTILKKIDYDYYEIFKNENIINENTNKYILNDDFTLSKLDIDLHSYIEKNNVYMNFDTINTRDYSREIIQSRLLDDRKFFEILNFYSKFLGTIFDKWLSYFGSWDRNDQTVGFRSFYFHLDVNILQCFIISNNFLLYIKHYFYIYNKIFYNIHYTIDDDYFSIFCLFKQIKIKNKDDTDSIEFIKLYQKNLITNNDQIYSFINTFKILIIDHNLIILDNPINTIIGFLKLTNINFTDIYLFIYILNQLISDNFKNMYIYNYLKLNTLIRIAMDTNKSFNDEKIFFKNIKNINKFINLDINKIKLLFFLEYFEELYSFYKFIKIIPNNDYILTILWYFYFKQLNDNQMVINLTNIQIEFPNSLYTDFSNKNLVDNSVYSFYNALTDTNSLLKNYYEIKYSITVAYRHTEDPITRINKSFPYCGEITLLNFFLVLIYNPDTKLIESSYLPETTNIKLKNLFTKYKKITDLISNTHPLIEFYTIIENINYSVTSWDNFSHLQIYKNAVISNGKFVKGIEYRLTYFNLCRITSYLLNLEGELKLEYIEKNGVTIDTLKNIISKFNNPKIHLILDKYAVSPPTPSIHELYDGSQITVKISDASFILQMGHSYPQIEQKYEIDIKKIVVNYDTFYKYPYSNKIWHILKSIAIAITKNEIYYAEINFDIFNNSDNSDTIKFFKILKELTPEYNITYQLIKSFIDSDKFDILNFIYKQFNISDKNKWKDYLYYIYKTKNNFSEFKILLQLYLKNVNLRINKKTNKPVINKIIFFLICENFLLDEYKQIEQYIDQELIQKFFYKCNSEIFTYVTRNITIFYKRNIIHYVKLVHIINYNFLNLFCKDFFNIYSSRDSLFAFAFHNDDYILIKFLIDKKVALSSDYLNISTSSYNDITFNNLYDNITPDNIFLYINNKKKYHIFTSYISNYPNYINYLLIGKKIIIKTSIDTFIKNIGHINDILNIDTTFEKTLDFIYDFLETDFEKKDFFNYIDTLSNNNLYIKLLILYYYKIKFKLFFTEELNLLELLKLFFADSYTIHNTVYYYFCHLYEDDFKTKIIDTEFIISDNYKYLNIKINDHYVINELKYIYYLPIWSKFFEKNIKYIIPFFYCMQIEKKYFKILIDFFRRNKEFLVIHNFYFIDFLNSIANKHFPYAYRTNKEVNIFLYNGWYIKLDFLSYNKDQQSAFLNFFGFILKNTLSYDNQTYNKQHFINFLDEFIKDLLSDTQPEEDVQSYDFNFKIINSIVSHYSIFTDSRDYIIINNNIICSLFNFIKNTLKFNIITPSNIVLIKLLDTIDKFNITRTPNKKLLIDFNIKLSTNTTLRSKYLKYKNKYLNLKINI